MIKTEISTGNIILFTHIPKCGGTSFRKGLEDTYKERLLSFYVNPLRHRLFDALEFKAWRIKNRILPTKLSYDVDIIYGHFCFDDLHDVPKSKKLFEELFSEIQ